MSAELHALRIGSGWDSHLFTPGRALWLGGMRLEHTHGLAGHSDGDVLLHAVCDALFGALADGDIGTHFPSSDPQWKNAASSKFVAYACARVAAAGWHIVNLDANLILQAPRLQPVRESLRQHLAALLAVPLDRVSIKAKTPEGLNTPDTAIAQVTVLLARV